jgi:hypothetical protein
MKYCKKCGMLLEDNMERCIGCGSDVTVKDSFTRYPEEIQKKIETEKKEAGKRNLTVVAIILIFVVIVLLIGIFAMRMYTLNAGTMNIPGDGNALFGKQDGEGGDVEDAGDNSGSKGAGSDRTVKDEEGAYYKYVTVKDDADHDIFTAVFPEDFSNLTYQTDYSWGSQVFPSVFSFVATNDDNTTQLTYRTVQHYQYITGESEMQVNVQDSVKKCISFYDFKDVESYLNEMVKQAYPSAKKVEQMASEDSGKEVQDKLDTVIAAYEKDAENDIPPLFGLSEGTRLTHKDTYKSSKIYNYRIVTAEDHAVSCKFYVPVFCEKYDFEDETKGFSGQLSDCYILALVSFEAGSDELYDWYEDAFDMFVNNSHTLEDFYKSTGAYADKIKREIEEGMQPVIIKGSDLAGLYNDAANISGRYKDVLDLTGTAPGTVRVFGDGDNRYLSASANMMFVNPDKQLIYATKAEDEYPGDDFLELKVN